MLKREEKIKDITLAFAHFSTFVDMNSSLNYFDAHKTIETVLIKVLNITYKREYINLNSQYHNHPAIDLGCTKTKNSIQITSETSRKKFNDTLKKFYNFGLDKIYSPPEFLIISARKSFLKAKESPYNIKTLTTLARDIYNLDDTDFNEVYCYIKHEFSYFWPSRKLNILSTNKIDTPPPPKNISGFIASQFSWVYDELNISNNQIRNYLLDAQKKLSELSEVERTLIYNVLYLGKRNKFDFCYTLPLSVIFVSLPLSERHELISIIEALAHRELADIDEVQNHYHIRVTSKHLRVYYYIKELNSDFFAVIADYLKKTGRRAYLKDVIENCNFSHIK